MSRNNNAQKHRRPDNYPVHGRTTRKRRPETFEAQRKFRSRRDDGPSCQATTLVQNFQSTAASAGAQTLFLTREHDHYGLCITPNDVRLSSQDLLRQLSHHQAGALWTTTLLAPYFDESATPIVKMTPSAARCVAALHGLDDSAKKVTLAIQRSPGP